MYWYLCCMRNPSPSLSEQIVMSTIFLKIWFASISHLYNAQYWIICNQWKLVFFLSGTGCRAIQCTWAGNHHFPASPFVMVSQVQLSSKSWPLLMEYNQCIAFKSMSAWRLLKIYKRLKFLPHREIPPLYKY